MWRSFSAQRTPHSSRGAALRQVRMAGRPPQRAVMITGPQASGSRRLPSLRARQVDGRSEAVSPCPRSSVRVRPEYSNDTRPMRFDTSTACFRPDPVRRRISACRRARAISYVEQLPLIQCLHLRCSASAPPSGRTTFPSVNACDGQVAPSAQAPGRDTPPADRLAHRGPPT